MGLTDECARDVISSVAKVFENNKAWADKAIAQVSDQDLRIALDPNTNSIVVIMKHVAGNLLSRWTEFLSSDGEKSWRNRDDEFVDDFAGRDDALAYWEKGWERLFQSLAELSPDDLGKSVTIRGEPHTVPLAMHRSLAHCSYHCGQIIMIARVLAGDEWETITVPRGGSESFNREVWGKRNFG